MERTCKHCGKVFDTEYKNQVFCSISCKDKYHWQEHKRKRAEEKEQGHSIEKINEEARKMGLSYGKYKAMLYKQQMSAK